MTEQQATDMLAKLDTLIAIGEAVQFLGHATAFTAAIIMGQLAWRIICAAMDRRTL